jgi:hypothetical protein
MKHILFALPLISVVAIACTAETDSVADDEVSLDDDTGSEDSDIRVAGRWTLSSAVRSAGMSQSVSYDSAERCTGGLTAGSKKLKSYLLGKFPNEIREIQGYNCRQIRGGSGLSMHGTGRALDIMIPLSGGEADNTKGDRVAEFLIRNAQAIGVQFIIWDRSKWKPGQAEQSYGGSHPHHDHLHIELTEEAASMSTSFFRGGSVDQGSTPPSGGSTPPPAAGPGTGCYSTMLKKQVPVNTCVQSSANDLWYRCQGPDWLESSAQDSKCASKHPL